MEFKIDSIILRKANPTDTNGFIEICSQKETMRYYGTGGSGIDTEEKALSQIEWCNSLFNQNAGRWIITEEHDDKYIGDIGFHNSQEEHHKAEIGFRLKQEFWGRGIMGTCIREVLNYGFTELKYNRIEALVDTRNENSKKVLLKNNFVYEGTLREFEYENDEYVSLEVYSILKSDFII